MANTEKGEEDNSAPEHAQVKSSGGTKKITILLLLAGSFILGCACGVGSYYIMNQSNREINATPAEIDPFENILKPIPTPLANGLKLNGDKTHPDIPPSAAESINSESKEWPTHPENIDNAKTYIGIVDELWDSILTDTFLEQYKHNLTLEVIEGGVVIQIVTQPKFPLFEVGTTRFTQPIKKLLCALVPPLSKMPNKIEINGHVSKGLDMWKVSAAMAEATREEFEAIGYPTAQISKVAGCANTRPFMQHCKSGSIEDTLNERISITLLPKQWKPGQF